jgi:hypothetical protein
LHDRLVTLFRSPYHQHDFDSRNPPKIHSYNWMIRGLFTGLLNPRPMLNPFSVNQSYLEIQRRKLCACVYHRKNDASIIYRSSSTQNISTQTIWNAVSAMTQKNINKQYVNTVSSSPTCCIQKLSTSQLSMKLLPRLCVS